MPDAPAVTVDTRFAGPPGSANGGYVAGRLAALVRETPVVQVTLRQPPPLCTRLDVTVEGDVTALTFGGAVIVEARPAELSHDVVDPVGFDEATSAMAAYAGLVQHPFPGCFVCGVDRVAPDGLCLRPGPPPGHPGTVATTWLPDPTLTDAGGVVLPEMVWAALDCPGGWSVDLVGRPMVLGRMTAAVDARPHAGDRCVVVGRELGTEGRKTFTMTTAYDGDGRVLGRAEATWIAVDPTRLGR
jgi:hypothetical protein